MAYTIGIDIGTYSAKGVLLDESGRLLASGSAAHELSMPRPGWAEHDAETDWWGGFVTICRGLLKESGIDPRAVLAVGVSGIAPCVLPVDEGGRALRPAILYGVDTRATAEIDLLEERLDREWIRETSGAYLSSQSAGPKILWLREREPEIWNRTRWIMNSSTYLAYRLTGEVALDNYTAAFYHPLFDVTRRSWDEKAAEAICPVEMLPKTIWSGDAVGEVLQSAAAETGLAPGTPVIAGSADASVEAVAAGVRTPGDTMVMYGSSNFLITVTEELRSGGAYWPAPFLWEGTFAYAGGMATAGSVTTWFRDNLARAGGGETSNGDALYQALATEAAAVAPGSNGLLALPYFSGERTPMNDPRARGVFAGLSLSHGRGHIFRSLLEGVGFGIRQNLEAMGALGGRLFGIGGGTKNDLWMQIVTDIIGEPQLLRDSPGASFGDAVLGALHAGILGSREDVEGWLPAPREIRPDSRNRDVYDRQYELFKKLYENTTDTVHALAEEQK